MSRLKSKKFECKVCNKLINPTNLASSDQTAIKLIDGKLFGPKKVVAFCEDGHPGAFPFYENYNTYLRHIEDGILFHIKDTKWTEEYIENPDSYSNESYRNKEKNLYSRKRI